MSRTILLLIFISLFITGCGYSQTPPIKFGLFGALSLPTGNFSDDTKNFVDYPSSADGFATLGFGAGLELIYPIGTPGLGWHTTAAFLYHGVDDKKLEELFGAYAEVDAGSYFLIPILTGLSYTAQLSPNIGLIIIGQGGLSLVQKTTMKVESTYDYSFIEANFDMATSFGFGIGAGFIFNDKFNISFRYLGLGEPEFEYTLEDADGDTYSDSFDLSVGAFLITAGIYF